MEDNNNWMVCVQCMTYNQAPYIEETLNGFTIQETTFPFVCCILDDASTDGEPVVIDKYLKEHFDLDDASTVCREETDDYSLLFARHKKNSNCYFAVLFLKYNHYSSPENKQKKNNYISRWIDNAKYLAICEGDDYWIDDLKLQRQVDILDSDPNCSLCYHACKNIFEDNFKGEKTPLCESVKEKLTFEAFMPGYPFQTASVVYRASVRKTPLYKRVSSGGGKGSIISIITIGQFGYFRGINEQMSVYRRNAGGVSVYNREGIIILLLQNQIDVCGFFSHEVKKRLINKSIVPMLFNLFLKSRRKFWQMVVFSLKQHPSILFSLVCYITTLFCKRVSNKIIS